MEMVKGAADEITGCCTAFEIHGCLFSDSWSLDTLVANVLTGEVNGVFSFQYVLRAQPHITGEAPPQLS